MLDLFYLFKVVLVSPFLIYACKVDLEERRVRNKVWKYMLLVFIPAVIIEFFLVNFNPVRAALQFLIIFAISYSFYHLGMWGGADAKALMVLALIFPVHPQIWMLPALNRGFEILAFSTLSNSVIFSPAVVLFVFLKNVKGGLKGGRILYYFTGYKVDADKIPRFHNLLEYINDGNLKRGSRGIEPTEKMISDLSRAKREGKIDKVWVTPGLPFLVFITTGFYISVIFGDILFLIISLIV